ncbi:MAG: cobalamin biosynthesis protein CobD, partial [Candidatus Nitrosothermus koennekii]
AIDDLDIARRELSMIVGRDTSSLDKEHILSAVIESISENITDGITSSLFYYSLFGITGAFIYRTINTLDSMLGYKDEYHKNIGYFSANLDTIANYIPARLTAFVTILSAMLLKMEWRNALRIIMKDSKNTPSLNSGWSIAGVAGALKVRLEKIGYYKIGKPYEEITVEHCYKAIKMMKITAILFAVIVALPLLIIRVYLIGWDFV